MCCVNDDDLGKGGGYSSLCHCHGQEAGKEVPTLPNPPVRLEKSGSLVVSEICSFLKTDLNLC